SPLCPGTLNRPNGSGWQCIRPPSYRLLGLILRRRPSATIVGSERTHPVAAGMRLKELDPHPLHEILFENAGPRRQGPETRILPVVRAVVDSLPSKLDAILVTGDLQGLEVGESARGAPRALGEVLAQELAELGERG